jgi:hypothetical protein
VLSANGDQSVESIVEDHPRLLLPVCLAGKCLARADSAALGHGGWDLPADELAVVPVSLEERSAQPPTSRTGAAARGVMDRGVRDAVQCWTVTTNRGWASVSVVLTRPGRRRSVQLARSGSALLEAGTRLCW